MQARITLTDTEGSELASWSTDDNGNHYTTMDLTFLRASTVNRARCALWHNPETDAWTGADWSNAMCGEAGEAANIVKKLRRHETGTTPQGDPSEPELLRMLADEIADVYCYLDLLAHHYGIDMAPAIVGKFNRVSERQHFPHRLP